MVHKDYHQRKNDRDKHYEELEDGPVSDNARKHFRRPAYGAVDVTGYMAKKYDIKKVMKA